MKEDYTQFSEKSVVEFLIKQDVAVQRVFYVFLKQKGYNDIPHENIKKNQIDGVCSADKQE